jgi:rhodanese-related sulfurtransferase
MKFVTLIALVIAISTSLSADNIELKKQMMSAFKAQLSDAKKSTTGISDKELAKWISEDKDFVLVDIREASEAEKTGVIKAKHFKLIPRGMLEPKIAKNLAIKPSDNVVLYCSGGPRSVFAAKVLQDFYGFKNVTYLVGGTKKWEEDGYKLRMPGER